MIQLHVAQRSVLSCLKFHPHNERLTNFVVFLGALLLALTLSLSLTSLHYAELIENDGVTLCEVTAAGCETSHSTDSDNDHETVQTVILLDLVPRFQLPVPVSFVATRSLFQYLNTYIYACLVDLSRPPAVARS